VSKKKYDSQIYQWIKTYKISIFILTLGEHGSILYTQKFKIKVKAKKVITKDSVGAGDNFAAFILNELVTKGKITKEVLKKAHYFASAYCLENKNI
ncbi:PfkB family carbohydrate kinase, partial [Pelagibacteraceae bacterium]|nr:PfkB family carbohydrate kinase [Pelagibacteraceae bacterium]